MHLRELHPSEYSLIAAWAIAEGWPGSSRGRELSEASFPELLQLPGHRSFGFGGQYEKLLGFGQIWTNENGRTSLVRLLIAPNRRAQGFGKTMCRLLCNQAMSISDSKTLWLRVSRQNHVAFRVYQGLGFEVVEEESNAAASAMKLNLERFGMIQNAATSRGDA